jgi:hypothetical protein
MERVQVQELETLNLDTLVHTRVSAFLLAPLLVCKLFAVSNASNFC